MKKLWSMVLVAMLVVVHGTADAKRMGGGGSVGKQSSNCLLYTSPSPRD